LELERKRTNVYLSGVCDSSPAGRAAPSEKKAFYSTEKRRALKNGVRFNNQRANGAEMIGNGI
jgi:hypothetical protein